MAPDARKMLTFLLLTVLLSSASTSPIDQSEHTATELATQIDQTEENLQKDLVVLSYIQNFKNVMTEYVRSQYNNLTINEIEKVKETIEEFLTNFAKDLRDVIEEQRNSTQHHNEEKDDENGRGNEDQKAVKDGLSDTQFDEIKARIRVEFPQITEKSAEEIVYRLRRNLLVTRQKLDGIIRESQRAQALYS